METAVFAVVLGVGSSEAFPAGLVGTQLMVSGTQILSPVVASDLLPRLSPEVAMSVGREFHRKRGNEKGKRFSKTEWKLSLILFVEAMKRPSLR